MLGDVLDEAKKTICGARQDQYGNPEDSFQLIADLWTSYLRHGCFFYDQAPDLKPEDVARLMALLKIARMVCGSDSLDSYIDLAGYAAIAGHMVHQDALRRDKAASVFDIPSLKDGTPYILFDPDNPDATDICHGERRG